MLKSVIINLIGLYQRYISIWLPTSCRFSPTCSEYALEAIAKYGVIKGILKAAVRLLKCHPFSGAAGYDHLIHSTTANLGPHAEEPRSSLASTLK